MYGAAFCTEMPPSASTMPASSVVIQLVGDMAPRQHSIMQDANDKNALRREAVEENMTTNFQTPEAKSNIVAGMPDARVVSQRLAACFKSV